MPWEKGQTGLERQKRSRPLAETIQRALEQRLTPKRMERMSKMVGVPISDEATHEQLLAEIILAMTFDGEVVLGDGVPVRIEESKELLDWMKMVLNHLDGPVQTLALDQSTTNNFNVSLDDWRIAKKHNLQLAQSNMEIFGEVIDMPVKQPEYDESDDS